MFAEKTQGERINQDDGRRDAASTRRQRPKLSSNVRCRAHSGNKP
jgi:hypothetical protein